MGEAAVPKTTEPLNLQSYLLELLESIELPESKYKLNFPEPMKFEETQASTAPQETAEDNTETSEREEQTPLLGTPQGFES